ncbi:hypothetical protein [Sphingomonas sp. Root710]|uniref:hypothetical protein n=1 Tax=Sphingomonas sp. Root710 TaxID=1736594 RepID=UPI0039E0D1DC
MPAWNPSIIWPGGFIASVEARRDEYSLGRARCWVRPSLPLLRGEPVSTTARVMGVVDIANGLTPLFSPTDVAFPNLDLTAHLLRSPVGEWIGFDISVCSSAVGIGLTHSILHDSIGPFAAVSKTLTVRPNI